MTSPLLTVRGLRCAYGDFEAVRGVDLDLRPGELLALLGTNGAGKTTVLETLQGHRRPSGGQVRVLGHDPSRQRRRIAADIGVMLQDTGFAPDLTVAETVRFRLRLDRRPDVAAATRRLLGEVGLDHRAGVRVRQLSGGERRRLDLAVALCGDPRLLFLDEPTTGLDPQSRENTWQVLRERRRRGTAVLLTTHYLEEAEALADRVAIMHEGRVVAAGTPAEVSAAQPAQIRCTVPRYLHGAEVTGLAGTLVWADEPGRLTVRTFDLAADLARLTDWADGKGFGLGRLQAVEASLADVFHHIAGSTGTFEGSVR